ncbi:MAG: hypothetical protein WAU01_16680 [Saprospiraceae bacterium]
MNRYIYITFFAFMFLSGSGNAILACGSTGTCAMSSQSKKSSCCSKKADSQDTKSCCSDEHGENDNQSCGGKCGGQGCHCGGAVSLSMILTIIQSNFTFNDISSDDEKSWIYTTGYKKSIYTTIWSPPDISFKAIV